MEVIAVTEREVAGASRELADLRMECSQVDAANSGLKKD